MLLLLRRKSWRIVALSALCVLASQMGYAQSLDLSGDALQRLLQGRTGAGQLGLGQLGLGQSDTLEQINPPVQIYQPVVPPMFQVVPPSRLETLYSSRAGRPLAQFGYDILGVPTPVSVVQVGGIQDNYIVNVGDEIIVDLRGQDNATYRQRVDRNGQLVLPMLNPIPSAGRTFGEVRADLERQVAQVYISTNAFASIGQIRQVSVLVTGEVRAPGTRILSGLSTPLDAILLSGGIAKTGSLRNILLIRGVQTIQLDLYSLLLQGTFPNAGGLRNGDRIYVPPLHNTVAVTGYVRRPGIYELREGQQNLEAEALIQLSGGLEIAGSYRLSKMNLEPDGRVRLISLPLGGVVANGEVLFIDSATDIALDRVTTAGAVRLPGAYPRALTPSLGRLIRSSEALSPDAYSVFAVIVRRDPRLNIPTLLPLSLVPVMSGTSDIVLQSDDLLYVFKGSEIRQLAEAATSQQYGISVPGPAAGSANNPGAGATRISEPPRATPTPAVAATPPPAGVPVTTFLAANGITPAVIAQNPSISSALSALGPDARIVSASSNNVMPRTNEIGAMAPSAQQDSAPQQLSSNAVRARSVDDIADLLGVPVEALVRTAADHVVWVLDKVRDPGPYLAGEGTTIGEIIQVAGGVARQADLSSVEVTSTQIEPQTGTSRTIRTAYKGEVQDLQRVSLRPLDVIRLRPVFSDREEGRVTVSGQVRYPGTFDITRGERLSSLLERAGGFTDTAYPFGAVFTRNSAVAAERAGNEREARAINAELGTLASSSNPNDRDKVSFLTSLAQQVQSQPVLGRITITADPAVLRVRPEFDIILEPGDTLTIPPRPATVTVTGEVLNSGSFQYRAGTDVRDYITVAGGVTQGADEGRIFVVLPDGGARPITENWLTFNNSVLIPPGSTIVVPRDLRPFDFTQFFKDATQITSQLAITAASLAVVGR